MLKMISAVNDFEREKLERQREGIAIEKSAG
jgi:DNA invertase Pin-like site-specific DNA recombinase